MEDEVVAELSSQFFNAVNGDFGGVVEVVNDDRPESAQQKLKNGVAANVSCTAGDQNAFGHYRRVRTLRETEKTPEIINIIKTKQSWNGRGKIGHL